MHFLRNEQLKVTEVCNCAVWGSLGHILSLDQSAQAPFALYPVRYRLANYFVQKNEIFVKIHFSLARRGWWDANVMYGITVDTACIVEGNA